MGGGGEEREEEKKRVMAIEIERLEIIPCPGERSP